MQLECNICLDHHPLATFQFLKCGHGYCAESIKKLPVTRGNIHCPTCRKVFPLKEVHPIYVSVHNADGSSQESACPAHQLAQQVESLKGPLDVLNAQSTPSSVKDTECSLRDVMKYLDGPCGLQSLVLAFANFLQRVQPLFEEVVSYRTQLSRLKETLRARDTEIAAEKENRTHAETVAQEALATAERAKEDIDHLADRLATKDRLTGTLTRQLEEQRAETQKFQNFIFAHKEKAKKREEKVKKLEEELEEAKESLRRSRRITMEANMPQDTPIYQTEDTQDSLVIDFDHTFEDTDDLDDLYVNPAATSSIATHVPPPAPPDLRPPARPTFGTDWNLSAHQGAKKRKLAPAATTSSALFPLSLDGQGKVKGAVQLGSRQRMGR